MIGNANSPIVVLIGAVCAGFVLMSASGCGLAQQGALSFAYDAYARGDFDKALGELSEAENYTKPSPELHAEIVFLRSQCLEGKGQMEEAVGGYKYIVQNYPTSEYAFRSKEKLASLGVDESSQKDEPSLAAASDESVSPGRMERAIAGSPEANRETEISNTESTETVEKTEPSTISVRAARKAPAELTTSAPTTTLSGPKAAKQLKLVYTEEDRPVAAKEIWLCYYIQTVKTWVTRNETTNQDGVATFEIPCEESGASFTFTFALAETAVKDRADQIRNGKRLGFRIPPDPAQTSLTLGTDSELNIKVLDGNLQMWRPK